MRRIVLLLVVGLLWFSPVSGVAQSEEGNGESVSISEEAAVDEDANEPTEANETATDEPTVVVDEDGPMPDEEAGLQDLEDVEETVSMIVSAAQEGNWGLVIAGVIMIVVFIMRKFIIKRIDADYVPWITAVLVNLVLVADALVSGASISQAFLTGFFLSTSAGGLWSLIGKHVAGEK
jgi:hypothetical protein